MTRTPGLGFTRRQVLAGSAGLIAATGFSPFLISRSRAAPGPGELALVPATPNPNGALDRLFLLTGDPLAGPVRRIVTTEGDPVPAPTLAEGERRVLRVLHFNDFHNAITSQHRKKGDTHTFSQLVKMVRRARAAAGEDEVMLFVSAGDDHTGSVFDELMGWSLDEFVADAGYRVYSAAGVDLAALGNHEFDRGAALLKKGIDTDARFPLLSANVHGSDHMAMGEDYFCAAVAVSKGLRVGVIGLTTAVDTRVGQPSDPGLAVASPVKAVENLLPAVAEVSDVVVIVSHCGFGEGYARSGKAGAAREIGEGDVPVAAAAGPLTDKPVVLIGGHSHTKLNEAGIDPDNMVNGVLVTQAASHGKYLGDVAMSIAALGGRKAWYSSVGLHPTKKRDDRVAADDPRYASLEHDGDFDQAFEDEHVAPLVTALDGVLAQQIGRVEPDDLLSHERTIADRYARETAIANFMNDAIVARSETFPNGRLDFALFNATGISAGVAAGELSFRRWYDVMPYADQIHVARLTGAQLRDMLDNNAKRVLRPGELTSGNFKLAGFIQRGFLHFSSGIRYRIELGVDATQARAVDITLNGTPVEQVLERPFTIAVNTYIALGGFGEAWNGKPIGGDVPGGIVSMDLRQLDYLHTGLVYRNEVIAWIKEVKTVGAATGARLDQRLAVG